MAIFINNSDTLPLDKISEAIDEFLENNDMIDHKPDTFWNIYAKEYEFQSLWDDMQEKLPIMNKIFAAICIHEGDNEFDETDDGYNPESDTYITDGVIKLLPTGYHTAGNGIMVPCEYSSVDVRDSSYIIFIESNDTLYILFDANKFEHKWKEILLATKKLVDTRDEF